MARAIDTASISFGLVAIPVRVFSTSEPSHEIHFHMIHAGCGQRVKQFYKCPKHGEVERSEIAKGYALDRSTTIELAQSELDALEAVGNDEIALAEFVPAIAVDPIYVERTYYLGPGKGGERAYRLLHDALVAAGLAGIAHYAARGHAYVVMLRPYRDGLAMHQLRYDDEIRPFDTVELPSLPKPKPNELSLARSLIKHLEHHAFDASAYRDEVKGRVKKLLADKAKSGETIEAPETAPVPHVADLMAALKASLTGGGAAPPSRSQPREKRPRAAARRRSRSRSRTARTR